MSDFPFFPLSRPGQPPPPPCYLLFISHAWDYTNEYDGIVKLLNAESSFVWENLSVPESNPLSVLFKLPKSYRYLVHQIDERISKADCLLVLAGMYVAHSGWIQSEIEAAKDFGKPIIAVAPRGQERFPEAVMHAADESVGWNKASIIEAIRKHTSRFPFFSPSFFSPPSSPY